MNPVAGIAVWTALMIGLGTLAARGWAELVVRRRFRRCGEEPPADDRLTGTWQSDGDATVAEWRERRPLTDEQAAQLRQMFGRLRVTWGPATLSTELDGRREEWPYRLIAVDDASAVVRAWSIIGKRDEFSIINFVGRDRYWLYAGGGPLREYFRRVG